MFARFKLSLSRGWTFIKAALALLQREKQLMVLPFIQIGAVFAVLLVFGLPVGLIGAFLGETGQAIAAILFFPVLFLAAMTRSSMQGMTVNMIDATLKGQKPSYSDAFADVRKNFIALAWISAISAMVSWLRNLANNGNRRGGLIVVLARLVMRWAERAWTIATYLLIPAVIIEDLSLKDALKRVREIHSNNILEIAVGEVGIGWITGLGGFLLFMVSVPVFVGSAVLGPLAPLVWIPLIMIWVTYGAFSGYVRLAYHTCLFVWAVAREENRAAEAPDMLAQALAVGDAA